MRPGRERGFTLIEVLAALLILAFVATAFLSVNAQNLRKAAAARRTAKAADLAREKLAEALLDAAPAAAEETDWQPFTDETGEARDPGWLWKRAVRELPFTPPGTAAPFAPLAAWEIVVSVATGDGDVAAEVTAWREAPPVTLGQ